MAEMDRVGFSKNADGIHGPSPSLSGKLCSLEFYRQESLNWLLSSCSQGPLSTVCSDCGWEMGYNFPLGRSPIYCLSPRRPHVRTHLHSPPRLQEVVCSPTAGKKLKNLTRGCCFSNILIYPYLKCSKAMPIFFSAFCHLNRSFVYKNIHFFLFHFEGKKKDVGCIHFNFSWTDSHGKKIAHDWSVDKVESQPAEKIILNGRGLGPGVQWQQNWQTEGSEDVGGIEAGVLLHQRGSPNNCLMRHI